jgi:hypothetical protein
MKVTFTVGGDRFTLTKEEVESKMRGQEPRTIQRYSIKIQRVPYPAKQVLQVATGLPPQAFTAQTAYRVLKKLGFDVEYHA